MEKTLSSFLLIVKTLRESYGIRRTARMTLPVLMFVLMAPLSRAQTYTVLHSFNGIDGTSPDYGALFMDGAGSLYGTTNQGGTGCNGCGVVFKLDPLGNETVLHSFTGGLTDGIWPDGGLTVDPAGNLYGVTTAGGANNTGTIYKIDTAGNESIVYAFRNSVFGGDGVSPISLTRDSSGNFYGVTVNGGLTYPNFHGTVFKLDPSGNESIFHNFNGSDGSAPYGELIRDAQGNLYGTTASGGARGSCYGGYGCGTVFKLDSAGNETVLHTFSGTTDGAYPFGGLLMDSTGNLYGTTSEGGLTGGCYAGAGCGTIYRLDAAGNFSVLYTFTGQGDGGNPFGAVIRDYAGNLYGTAEQGGDLVSCAGFGCGVIFKVDAGGNQSVIHAFNLSDGATPISTLLMDSARNVYGTTLGGGSSGDGVVFKIALGTAFAANSTKLAISAGPPPGFALKAQITQGAGAPAIDPVSQEMVLKVGSYVVSIPVGSFSQNKKGAYVYVGTINGVSLQIRIQQIAVASYQVQVTASGVDLTTLPSPIPVTITIGYNTGTVAI